MPIPVKRGAQPGGSRVGMWPTPWKLHQPGVETPWWGAVELRRAAERQGRHDQAAWNVGLNSGEEAG